MSFSNKKKVLITGAGGAAIPGLIERLKNQDYIVMSADMDSHAVGLYFADKSFIIPPGNSIEFFNTILNICINEKIDAVIPLVDEELLKCKELEKHNISVILPRYEFIETCLDKYTLMKFLENFNISIPKTKLAIHGYDGLAFPIVVKPRTGRGSRGLKIANSEQELLNHLETTDYAIETLLFQEYIEGTEYTVSVVVWKDGQVQAVVPKEIISKKGVTKLAVTRHNDKIDALCRKVQACLHADGPFNVQLRLDIKTGEPLIFEINPRFSTTVSLTIACGVDELGGLISQAIYGKSSNQFTEWQDGVVLIRQTLDRFINETDFLTCSNKIIKN